MLQRRLRRFPSSGSSTALPAASARNDRDHRSYWTDRANGPRRTDGTYGSSRSDWRNRCCRTNWSNRLDRRNRADWACWSNRSYWCYWRHRSNGTCRTDWCYWRYRGYRPCRNHHCRACCRGYSDQQRHDIVITTFNQLRISASGWCDRRIVTSLKVSFGRWRIPATTAIILCATISRFIAAAIPAKNSLGHSLLPQQLCLAPFPLPLHHDLLRTILFHRYPLFHKQSSFVSPYALSLCSILKRRSSIAFLYLQSKICLHRQGRKHRKPNRALPQLYRSQVSQRICRIASKSTKTKVIRRKIPTALNSRKCSDI